MGEIAEMHLDGTLCEACGVFLDGESPGYPRYCSADCAEDRDIETHESNDYKEPNIENIKYYLEIAGDSIQIAIYMIKKLKLKGKVKELSWLINRLAQYYNKIDG